MSAVNSWKGIQDILLQTTWFIFVEMFIEDTVVS